MTLLLFLSTMVLLSGISCRTRQGNCSFTSILLTIVFFRFFFLCVCHSDSSIYFLGASIVCVNNLKRTADLVISLTGHLFPRHQNDLILLTVLLNLTKATKGKIKSPHYTVNLETQTFLNSFLALSLIDFGEQPIIVIKKVFKGYLLLLVYYVPCS